MNIFFTNDSKLNDIIFENRLKEYGAFELRKTAWIRELQGFLIGLALVFCILYPIYLKSMENTFLYNQSLTERKITGCTLELETLTEVEQKYYTNITELKNFKFGPPIVVEEVKPIILKLNSNIDLPSKFNVYAHKSKLKNYLIFFESEKIKIPPKFTAFIPFKNEFNEFPCFFEENRTPQFKNGLEGLRKYIKNSLKYPFQAHKNNIEGVVFVQFIVELNGTISYIKIVNKLSFGTEKEALRLIYNMPKWKPAIDNWKKCRSIVTLPIIFKAS